ncbi:MAG: hypothetical protein Q4G24_13970 [Paracoccus sp. (in: a-proteobacteria)]|uniref:hypothetical protein n=1 Tax=Paracoccus sp. TaxID=267 RepID=UPI0026DF061C|nr:hypothetical protein [Paracoccus sp. (in: a-proteobacteria)]MDO5622565.1 hypothetical protein [Paracoccus sp. (in: a-proteobacteria)]
MLFPNIQMSCVDLSVQPSIIPVGNGFADISRDRSQDEPHKWGVIEACTASDQEISERSAAGEFPFDVIEEHITQLWFSDRGSFRAAWRAARSILRHGSKVANAKARIVTSAAEVNGTPVSGLFIQPSCHHIVGAA